MQHSDSYFGETRGRSLDRTGLDWIRLDWRVCIPAPAIMCKPNSFCPVFLSPTGVESTRLLVTTGYSPPLRRFHTHFYCSLWGTASNSNLEILERFQSKVLRIITDAPWFIPNAVLRHDLQVPTVKQEARKYSVNCRKRLDVHPNSLANALFQDQLGNRRLKRLYPCDLATNS